MPWIIGVDEAGYGPNLGPFVMAAAACRVPDDLLGADLWDVLKEIVGKAGCDGGRIAVDDSKKIYEPSAGLGKLEHGVLSILWRGPRDGSANLKHLLSALSADCLDDLGSEAWFQGDTILGTRLGPSASTTALLDFDRVCATVNAECWQARAVVVPARPFNNHCKKTGSKGEVLAHSLCRLIGHLRTHANDAQALVFFVDKHGGRNTYAPMIQHALPDGMVLAERESSLRSVYRVEGLDREVRLTFQPRADAEHFCVALASMLAKYLREMLMHEFNRFWTAQVPGLKPTAGYPGDSRRFMKAIRPAAKRLGIPTDAIWRRR